MEPHLFQLKASATKIVEPTNLKWFANHVGVPMPYLYHEELLAFVIAMTHGI